MSILDVVSEYKKIVEAPEKQGRKKTVITHIVCFFLGFFYSIAGFKEGFSPFGIAFACSAPRKCLITSTAGAIVGYFISLDSINALRYTASVLAMAVIVISLNQFKDIRDNIITPVAVVFLCVFVTGLAMAMAEGINASNLLLCFSESVVGGASAYVFTRLRAICFSKSGISCITSKDATVVVIAVTLFLLAIDGVSFFSIYPAHIIASVLILLCAFYGRESGGAIVGICTGITMTLGNGNVYLMGIYAVGGLLSGVFSQFGKVASVSAFVFSGVAITMISFGNADIITLLIEMLVASVVFLAVTIKGGSKLDSFFMPAVTSPIIDSVKADIVSKLKRASSFSAEICGNVTAVNEALDKSEKSDCSKISLKVKNRVCDSCGLVDTCWKESFDTTKSNFDMLLSLKKQGVYLDGKTLPQSFACSCIRTENICSCFNKLYSEFKIKQRMDSRVREIHSLAAEQFINMSSLLESLSESIEKSVRFDVDAASRIRASAINCGLNATESCCTINELEKMTVEIKVHKPLDRTLLQSFANQLEIATDRKFELPELEDYSDLIKLIYREKALYNIISAGVTFNSNGEKYSGDSYSTFRDNSGYFYAALCDGMGTGAKAAVSSSLAISLIEKLIKAGFGIEASIKTVNTALISKSNDECSVTLDLFVFDMYTGHCVFYKCGAADTVVKHKGRLIDVGFDSMPMGILNDIAIDSGSGNLETGDIVVLCTDGVREEDYIELKRGVKLFCEGNVRNFTSEISEIIRRAQPEKNDDMTVLTLVITKN